jgi:hypothetical protein
LLIAATRFHTTQAGNSDRVGGNQSTEHVIWKAAAVMPLTCTAPETLFVIPAERA